MNLSIVQMAPTARIIVEQVLAIKPKEKVCIFTDTQCPQSITQLLAATSQAAGAETVIVTIIPREVGGVDPPLSAVAAIQAADVVIGQASYGIIHTNTVRDALKRGIRVCDMWGFTEDMMVRGGATADYKQINEISWKLQKILASAREARLQTKDGSDLTMSLVGRPAHVLAGSATQPGQFCAFPDGETAISPLEGSATGILINPICLEKEGFGFIKEGLRLKIEKGKAVDIQGGMVASQLVGFVKQIGEKARNIAELGLGTNPKSRVGVSVRETKKAWGTVHIALGDNKSLGGKVEAPFHMDMIFREPTLLIDGKTVIKEGQISV